MDKHTTGCQYLPFTTMDMPNKRCVVLHHFANRTHRYHTSIIQFLLTFKHQQIGQCTNRYHRKWY